MGTEIRIAMRRLHRGAANRRICRESRTTFRAPRSMPAVGSSRRRGVSLQPLELLPVLGDALAAQRGERDGRVRLLADEALLDLHEPGVLELGQVARQVP